jgi:hypothetical protein
MPFDMPYMHERFMHILILIHMYIDVVASIATREYGRYPPLSVVERGQCMTKQVDEPTRLAGGMGD